MHLETKGLTMPTVEIPQELPENIDIHVLILKPTTHAHLETGFPLEDVGWVGE